MFTSVIELQFILYIYKFYIYMKQQSWMNQTKLSHREHGHVILQHVSVSRVITNPIYNNKFLSRHSSFVAGLGFRFSMITYILYPNLLSLYLSGYYQFDPPEYDNFSIRSDTISPWQSDWQLQWDLNYPKCWFRYYGNFALFIIYGLIS